MGSSVEKDFLPRDQVVRNCIAFWRDIPGSEDILADLINEDTKKKTKRKPKKKKTRNYFL